MKKTLIIGFILIFCLGSTYAQKKSHKEFLKSMESENLKSLSAGCQLGRTITEISLNNVRTYLHTNGLFWTKSGSEFDGYEIPKGSGKNSIYAGGLWIGGTDINGNLKLAAVKYVGGRNYWPGPLKTEGTDSGTTDYETCYQFDKHYQINKQEVKDFRAWYNSTDDDRSENFRGYSIPETILDWPAHGNQAAGYDYYLAPFWDNNNDGSYNPFDGDYPFFDLDGILSCGTSREERRSRLYGDQNTWWVYNDKGNIHSGPNGDAIGMEIRAQAFQFSTNDELNDMSFLNFELINRSNLTIYDTYLGLFVDGDLGYAFDDFTGCDVSRGVGYFYNSESIDGNGEEHAYGINPPAIGFDFLEGPYKDPNGIDDCSSYDENNNLICNECILNGNINGLNFGDGIVDNERLGLSKFIRYTFGEGWTGPTYFGPETYYNQLQGLWRSGEKLRYFGKGHPKIGGYGPETSFAFPGNSDPCGWGQGGVSMPSWTEENAGQEGSDRRFVMSSGPFTMEPGSVNDVTIGVVWARSYEGGIFASVDKMLQADDKAQKLFENCFKIVDGPDAPELTILEQDKKLIIHIWNKPNSNNYLERYKERDPYIVCPENDPECDTDYKFQGYQIWQLRDHNSSLKEVFEQNAGNARLVFQCDIQDGISQIVNYEWDQKMRANIPRIEVEGADLGIQHTFVLEEDLFSEGLENLVNFKDYYYVAIAYAHNNYQNYTQNNYESFEGQKMPYKAGRKGAGGAIKIYTAYPHNIKHESPGFYAQSAFGDSPSITQIEGHGSGLNVLDMTSESRDAIMAGPPWKVDIMEYEAGRGPFDVKVIDPNSVIPDLYTLKFDSVNYFQGQIMNGKIFDANWYIYNTKGDTVFSESMIISNYEQLILDWGLSINITQQEIPYQSGSVNNGFLEATMEFEDPAVPWLSFVPNDDRDSPRNWIRSGYTGSDYDGDRDAVYENVLGGTWAPFQQAFLGTNGVSYNKARAAIDTRKQRLGSVDIYFTPNRDLWTRSPVVETTDDETLSIGNAEKFDLRTDQSVDKWGVPAEIGIGLDSANEDAASYIRETGMGWFPGYAIDVATGERLNIVYGESSWLTGDNGADMMWNPSTREGSKIYEARNGVDVDPLEVFFGGKHFIYIMGHNQNMRIDRDIDYMPSYDAGIWFMEKMLSTIPRTSRYSKRELFKNAMWCAIPLLNPDHFDEDDIKDDPYGFVKNELKIRLRVVDQYCVDIYEYAVPDSISNNNNKPMYTFDTFDLEAYYPNSFIDPDGILDPINIVPNPYYGSSGYSRPEHENAVKIINLPPECTISIYSLSGNLVKRINKEKGSTWLAWDLKNDYGVPIAGGVYIIHIDVLGVGEKTLKWMGAMR